MIATALQQFTQPNGSRSTKRILLISEDAQLRALLCEFLTANGYDVVAVRARAPGAGCAAGDCDAAIVDTAAPDGVRQWLRALDTTPRVPTIAVATAPNEDAARWWNRVDVVLQRPLEASKLVLIVRGLLAGRRDAAARGDQVLTKGPLTLHPLLNAATVEARETALTDVETRVLRELMLAASTPVPRDRLVRCGLGRGRSPDDRCLDTHIKRLRRKLGSDRQGRTPIRTVRGIGYLLLESWQPAG